MAQETVFLDEAGVLVTNTRVVTPLGDTYSLANVTSCKSGYTVHEGEDKKKARLRTILFWGGIALGIVIAIFAKFWYGIIVAAIGVVASLFVKADYKYNKYIVYLGSASGESQAIESVDKAFIDRVVRAINEAIISRG